MKTKIEVGNYEIKIEENEEMISIEVEKDGEVIEELTFELGEEGQIQAQGEEGEEGEDIKGFDEFGEEEEDFEGGEDFESEDFEGGEEGFEGGEEERTVENFQSFMNKRR